MPLIAGAIVMLWTGDGGELRSQNLWVQEAQLAPNLTRDARVGDSVAIWGDVAVIGEALNNLETGAVHVYRWDGATWNLEATLRASDGAPDHRFGVAVSIHHEVIVIGAPGDDSLGPDSGSAYVFAGNGSAWVQQQKVTLTGGMSGDEFGSALALEGSHMAIGAPKRDAGGMDNGAVAVFEFNGSTWVQGQELTHFNPLGGSEYGAAVDLHGDVLATATAVQETVHLHRWNGVTWQLEQSLVPASINESFGAAVALGDDVLMVGAPDRGVILGGVDVFRLDQVRSRWVFEAALPGAISNQGNTLALHGPLAVVGAENEKAIGLYRRGESGWSLERRFIPEGQDCCTAQEFGHAVAVHEGVVLASAPFADPRRIDEGAVYVLRSRVDPCDRRFPDSELRPAALTLGAALGTSLAVEGDTALVGAYFDDGLVTDAGSARVFRRSGSGWVEQDVLLAPDGQSFDRFGWSLDLDPGEGLAAVGAYLNNAGKGAVYVFRWNGSSWLMEQKLTSAAPNGRSVGRCVSIDGNWLLTSAFASVELFQWNGAAWVMQQSFPFSGAVESVQIDGNVAAAADNQTTVKVFRHNGMSWSRERTITLTNPVPVGSSRALSLDGNVLVIGEARDGYAGVAYVYRYDGTAWNLEDTVSPADVRQDDDFGWAVDVRGDLLAVSSDESNTSFPSDGLVYLFRFDATEWREIGQVVAPPSSSRVAPSSSGFGDAVALDGDRVLIGAPGARIEGAVYSVELGMSLDAFPATAGEGKFLTFKTCRGAAGGLALLFVMDVNGVPLVQRLATGLFDPCFEWSVPLVVPPGLAGIQASFVGLGLDPFGVLRVTDPVAVTFL